MARRHAIEGRLTSYVSCGQAGNATTWSCGYALSPWRQDGGPWQATALLVDVPRVPDREARAAGRWNAGDAIRIAAAPPRPTRARGPDIELLARGWHPARRFRGTIPERAEAPSPPARVDDRVLGRLRFDAGMAWYGTWRARPGARGRYEAAIVPAAPLDDRRRAADLERGRRAIVAIERGLARTRAAIAAKLLPTYTRTWRGDGPALTARALAQRCTLASIIVDARGVPAAIFETGAVFGDHGVEVRFTRAGAIARIALA